MIIKKNRLFALKLHKLAKKIYNRSTVVIVDTVIRNMIKSLFNILLIRDEDYELLLKYF